MGKSSRFPILLLLVPGLILSGIGLILLRNSVKPVEPQVDHAPDWLVSYYVSFTPRSPSARIQLALPRSNELYRAYRESLATSGTSTEIIAQPETESRLLSGVSLGTRAKVKIEGHFYIRFNGRALSPAGSTSKPEKESNPELYLGAEPGIEKEDPAVTAILREISAETGTRAQLIENITDFCREIELEQSNPPAEEKVSNPSAVETLTNRSGSGLGINYTLIALCRGAGIPARLVTGFDLSRTGEVSPVFWVEMFHDNRWLPIDPVAGTPINYPKDRLPITKGKPNLVRLENGKKLRTYFALKPKIPATASPPESRGTLAQIFDLNRLPGRMENAIIILLLMPLGGLITSIIHHFGGIKTFGYFTPSLIAVGFLRTPLVPGIIIFVTITSLGLFFRFGVGRLNLTKRPRLSLMLVLIVFIMTLGAAVMDFYRISPTSRGIVLPMVALTFLIERFFRNAKKVSLSFALTKFAGTLLAAVISLLIFNIERVQWLVLNYPEVELFIAAGLILVGLYRKPEKPRIEPLNP